MTQFCLTVWGEYALFTRPEMKVERVSYDVITPSAARAVFEAVFWKPAFRWQVERIEVLKPVKWANIRRNEVANVASYGTLRSAMQGGTADAGIFIEEDRQQRAATLLKQVKYRLYASQIMTDKAGAEDNPRKLAEMFERRASKGQCFTQPYLGCREFSAGFSFGADSDSPIPDSMDLGWMLHDMDFTAAPPQPRFFRAHMETGSIIVPPFTAEGVRA